MTTTTKLGDFLGRAIRNINPGTSNATDYLGRNITASDKDYMGRSLQNTPQYPPAAWAVNTAYTLGQIRQMPGTKRVETMTATGSPTGNAKVTVTKDGQTLTTGNIAMAGISAGNIQTALVALANVDPGDVTVAGSGPYTFTWEEEFGNVPTSVADNTGLSGGTFAIAQTTAGDARGGIYQNTVAGTSHAANKFAAPAVGATVTDGTATWKRLK
jgi:hypothetical protein